MVALTLTAIGLFLSHFGLLLGLGFWRAKSSWKSVAGIMCMWMHTLAITAWKRHRTMTGIFIRSWILLEGVLTAHPGSILLL